MERVHCLLVPQIQQNIREFGGDPDNVCAFGESAGAFAIANLLVYKRSVLFQRAVMQSAAASTMVSSCALSPIPRPHIAEWSRFTADTPT